MQDIRNEIDNISEIVPIPSTVTLILSRSIEGEIANKKLIQIILADAVLTALVLRATNSAFYGIRSGVSTVEHAVTLLGYTEISRLVLTYEMKQRLFRLNPEQRDFLNQLWLHSLTVATASRIIAKYVRYDTSGEEFTAGLLHDMGKIVLAQHFPVGLTKMREMIDELFMTDREAELQLFAIDHTEIGELLGKKWNLPGVITDAMRYHHEPAYDGPHQAVTVIVRMADLLSERWNMGIGENGGEISVAMEAAWGAMSGLFPALHGELFEVFEENMRMEFENNMAFSELFT